jgi:hypothetical protein
MIDSGWRLGSVGLALLFALSMPVQAKDAELPQCRPHDISESLFNPDGDPAKRQAALETWESYARKRGNYSGVRHELGSLYRLGREHPAALVDRDLEKAELLLSHAALGGSLMAMAGVAEVKLAQRDFMGAMVWAQAYLHFKRKLDSGSRGSSEAYAADLLDRIYARLGRSADVEQEIVQYAAAFVTTHGAKIESSHGASDDSGSEPTCQNPSWHLTRVPDAKDDSPIFGNRETRKKWSPGMVLFELWVNPEGKVAHAFVVDALPDGVTADTLREAIKRMRFNTVDAGTPFRVARLPMYFNDNSISLRD